MPTIETYRKQARLLLRWHREKDYSLGGKSAREMKPSQSGPSFSLVAKIETGTLSEHACDRQFRQRRLRE